jgi:hypothetical protein
MNQSRQKQLSSRKGDGNNNTYMIDTKEWEWGLEQNKKY